MNRDTVKRAKVLPSVAKEIIRAIEGLSYGEVLIKVHDGRVVLMEKKEKKVLDKKTGDPRNGAISRHY